MKKRNKNNLTSKQAKFVAALKKNPTMPLQKAAKLAGYSSPPQSANENLKKPNVRNALKLYLRALEAVGVDDDKSARVISEAMDAKKIHGTDEYFIEIDDHPTRLKANEQYLKLKRLIGYDEDEEKNKERPIQILIVDYGKSNSDPNQRVPAAAVSPQSVKKSIKIQHDLLAPESEKNNALP